MLELSEAEFVVYLLGFGFFTSALTGLVGGWFGGRIGADHVWRKIKAVIEQGEQ